jgi:hypothetical protein
MPSLNVRLRNKDGSEAFSHPIEVDRHYENWWREFGSAELRRVYENFGMEVFRRSSCLDGFRVFAARNGFTGKCCVEIGTCHGLTAIALSRLFERVVSIDIEDKPIKRELVAFLGIKNISFHEVAHNGFKADLIAHTKFDAAYVDGDHQHDTQFDFDLVRKCRRVLFHEYWPLQPQVWELVNDLRDSGDVVTHSNYALWTARG